MSKLWLIGLAASAAWAPAAIAQHAPPPPPPPPMAHGVHAPGAPMTHPGMHHPRPGQMGAMHQRFGRGHVVPPQFRGRQFIVNDWRMFGFPAPMPGGRWIRYHDDALLIDGDGRVMDGRYGWDWDRHGERMAHDEGYDEDYAGSDYGRDEDYGHDEDMRGHHGDRGERVVRVIRRGDGYRGDRGDCRRSCTRVHVPPPHPGYGYGYGAGCGCGPVVVTETITTTAPVVETRTYYETVYEHRAAPRRHYSKPVVRRYAKPVVRRSVKAAPRPGERG
ncbi:MAG: RcnB family protein [Allosphingosinicella sp.]